MAPQNMFNNGRIYRGQAADTHDHGVVITCYSSTLLVRVQGAGHALWVNKNLPSMADKVMNRITELRSRHLNKPTPITAPTTPCTPNPSCTQQAQYDSSLPKFDMSSTPIIGSLPNSPIPSGLQDNHIRNIIMFAEQKGRIETENCILKKTITELEEKISRLHGLLTEKETQLQFSMARASEIDLVVFQSECNKKLLESERRKFAEERDNLLQQIQDLTSQQLKSNSEQAVTPSDSHSHADTPTVPSYSDVVKWSTVPSRNSSTGNPTQTSPPVQTSNRFTSLQIAEESDQDDASKPQGAPTDARKRKNRTVRKSRPRVVLFGDSIGKRIDPQRLSRRADVNNLCVGGRKIESVDQNIKESNLANADTVITHVGTNNLINDSVDTIMRKFDTMSDTLKHKVPEGCEIAVSSIIVRNDRPDIHSKLDTVNNKLEELCTRNKWTFIDNKAVRDLHKDNLHPNDKGMSYLARNLQDFLRCTHPSIFQQGRKQTCHRQTQSNRDHIPVPLPEDVPMWLKYLMPKNMARMPYLL